MKNLPFDSAAIDYTSRIQQGRAPLSRFRLTVVGQSGERHRFSLHVFAPYFEKEPRHYFTPCGRFVMMRHRVVLPGDDTATTIDGQYHVFYRGVAIPEHRYAITTAIREKGVKQTAQYKRTGGLDPSVTEAMRETARQQQ